MTVNLTETTLYVVIILVLMGIQIYQLVQTRKLEKECRDLWDQLGTLTFSITNKMLEMQKDLNDKQDKK
jgi:high-affinity nickel permease